MLNSMKQWMNAPDLLINDLTQQIVHEIHDPFSPCLSVQAEKLP